MAAPSVMVFQFIGEMVSNATEAFVTPAASNLITVLGGTALSGLTLYFVLQGYAIMTGQVQEPGVAFLKTVCKSAIIIFIGLNAGNYSEFVVGSFNGLETGLSAALSVNGTPASIYQTLDGSLQKGLDIVGICMQKADDAGWSAIISAFGWLIAALVVAIGTSLVTILGGATVIVAKFSLAIMFAVGPLFIMCLLWPMTAKFFDSWFGQVLNYTLTVVFVAVVMSFAMVGYDAFIQGANFAGEGNDNPLFAALQIGVLTGILMFIIYQVGGMASGLAGGISMTAMTLRQIASPVTGARNAAMGMGHALNPVSTRRDLQSGMMTSGSRMDHLSAGNTVLNPAYRQALRENMGRNWGAARGGGIKGV